MLVFPAIDITDTENAEPRQRALSHDPHIPWRPDRTKFDDLLGDGKVIVDTEFSKTRIPGRKRREKLDASRVYLEPVADDAPTEQGVLYTVHKDFTPKDDPDPRSPLTRLIDITPDLPHEKSMLWRTVTQIRMSTDQLLWLKMVMG